MRHYSQINLFFRSLLFSICFLTTMVPYSVLCLFLKLFPLSKRYVFLRAYLKYIFWLLKHICHIDYKVEGLENIPANRNGVVMSKHQSTLETFLLPLYFHDPAIIAKRELTWIPFFGWGLAAADPIAINRSEKRSAMTQVLEKGTRCLQEGRWVMFFPEGTRVPYGVIGHYKLGGARLAEKAGYPVIPVAHDAGRYWPRRKFIKQPGTVQVVIGPLIETEGRSAEEILHLTRNWIENTMQRLYATTSV